MQTRRGVPARNSFRTYLTTLTDADVAAVRIVTYGYRVELLMRACHRLGIESPLHVSVLHAVAIAEGIIDA